jgi:hypothetical protein
VSRINLEIVNINGSLVGFAAVEQSTVRRKAEGIILTYLDKVLTTRRSKKGTEWCDTSGTFEIR